MLRIQKKLVNKKNAFMKNIKVNKKQKFFFFFAEANPPLIGRLILTGPYLVLLFARHKAHKNGNQSIKYN